MQFKKNTPLDLTVQTLAYEGVGIAKIKMPEGGDFVIFVENVCPGDVIKAEVVKSKKNYAMARMTEIIEPSALRIKPRCKHFDTCGGCTWQFLDYEEQLKFKENFVREAFVRIGGFESVDVEKILPAPSPWFYRNKMEYSFGEVGGELSLGLHLPKRFADIFDLEECHLQSEISVKICRFVKEWAREKKLSFFNSFARKGLLKNLIVREARSTGERMVNLVTSGEEFSLAQAFSDDLLGAFPREIQSLLHTKIETQKGSRTRITETVLRGKESITEILRVKLPRFEETLQLAFDIKPQAFFQPNPAQAETLYALALHFADPTPEDVVFDLYCGTGTIGMFFTKIAKHVYGIELNQSAIESAQQNAERNNIGNITFLCGDAGKMIPFIEEKPSIVLVDPPRAGLAPEAVAHIKRLAPHKVVYVSCNPATMARDIKELCEIYELRKVRPIDLFPQTYHVEAVALLVKK